MSQKPSALASSVIPASDTPPFPITGASGTLSATVVQPTAAQLNATVAQPTANQLNATVVQPTAANLNATVTVSGSATVAGAAAHDAAVSGNPVRIAGRALTAAYTTVATGDTADLVTTLQGVLVTRPFQIPELEWSYAAASGGIINTTDVALAAAAGAGLRRYLTSITLSNNSATATEVVIKDGATTVIARYMLPANAPTVMIRLADPIKTTANAALNVACISSGAAVYVNAQGYTAP